jgi:2'-5' RNA ligase
MGVLDRITDAARSFLSEPGPEVQSTQDTVDDPNLLARASRGVLGDLWYNTSTMYNAVTGVGTSRDTAFFNSWAIPRPLRRAELYGMGRTGLIYQALSRLPNTATREGWRVVITDEAVEDKGAVSDTITAYEDRLGIPGHCARAITRGRQYGEAMVILGVEDGRSMREPVDVDSIETIRWAVVIDVRFYEPRTLYQADSQNFGSIETFTITDINGILEDGLRLGPSSLSYTTTQLEAERQRQGGNLVVHADRVLHFPTIDHLPLLDTLQGSLGAFFEAMSGIRTAARESTTVVYKIGNWLRKAWSENAPLAQQHMAFVDKAKSSMNAWVLDRDHEDVDIKSRSLGGLADLANPFMVWLSAELATPVTVLWGVSPGGFGKGEAERETWHEEVRAFQRTVLGPQLQKEHGYILAAADGCQLPPDTQRVIEFSDLSPPDEEVRSKLRSEALGDLTSAYEKGGITRDEYRVGVAALNDDYFRVQLTAEGERVTKDALVGAVTGAIEILKAAGLGEIPAESARIALARLIPSSFDEDAAAEIIAPIVAKRGASPSPENSPDPGDIEDDEFTEEQPDELELLWSEAAPPADAMSSKKLAALPELGATTGREITLAAKAGAFPIYRNLYGKPVYSLAEVKAAVLSRNGRSLTRDATDADTCSVCIVLKAPDVVARWVPYKATEPSAPHVTVLYVGDVDTSKLLAVLLAAQRVVTETPPIEIDFNGVGYFDSDEKRVAFARVIPTADLDTLHNLLREALRSLGVEVKHFAREYVPHLTLAYLAPGEMYDGPEPQQGWTATGLEVWCDNLNLPLTFGAPGGEDASISTADTASDIVTTHDPFANQHAARQRDPDAFIASTFRRKNIAEGVDVIVGKLKSDPRGGMVVQTYRFDASKFTPAQARKWLVENETERRALEEATRDAGAWLATCDELSEEKRRERIDEAFAKFHETVNMSASELERWAETEWSRKASLSREPITRNLRLLRKRKADWTLADASGAMKTVKFVARMRGNERGEPVKIDGREGPSKRDISLKNWAFDPSK